MSEAYVPTQQPQACQEARLSSSDVDPGRAGGPPLTPTQGSRPPVRLIWRVDRRELFVALRSAERARSGPVSVSYLPGDASEPPRVAFSVGRRFGSAVERNRVRRRLRQMLRQASPPLPPGAYLVGVGPSGRTAGYQDLQAQLERALARALATPPLPAGPDRARHPAPGEVVA